MKKFKKKAIRTITHSDYIAHTEPLLKELHLLNVRDMFSLKILKFLRKLSHNELPIYFEVYLPHLKKIVTPYIFRPHLLTTPLIATLIVYAESCLVYQLVLMINYISREHPLILLKIEEKSHSAAGFTIYVINTLLDKYTYECVRVPCRTCNRLVISYIFVIIIPCP